MARYIEMHHILLCGDFNSRTCQAPDYESGVTDINANVPSERSNEDIVSNKYVTQHAKTRLFSKIKFFEKNPPSDSALCSVHFKTNCMKIGRVFPKIQLLKTKKSNPIFWHSTIEKTVFKGNH